MKAGIYPDERVIKIDNYALSEFRTCPRKFQHRIAQNLVPGGFMADPHSIKIPDAPLLFGIAIHKALDAMFMQESLEIAQEEFLEAYQPVPEDTKRTPGRGLRLLEAYWKRWHEDDNIYDTVTSELYFEFELGSMPVYGESWTVVYGGLVDKILSVDDLQDSPKLLCMDHKTSTWESQYLVPSFQLSNQFIGYVWATQQIPEYERCRDFIVDVLLISPKNDSFFRSELNMSQEIIDEWKRGIIVTCRQILSMHKDEFYPMYGKDACTSWNRLCPYFDICGASHGFRDTVQNTQYSELVWDTSDR